MRKAYRRTRITPTLKGTEGQIPKCKQCLEMNRIKLWIPWAKKWSLAAPVNGDEQVVRFMGVWACRIHYKIDVKGRGDVMLKELFVNREHRRGLMGKAHVHQA